MKKISLTLALAVAAIAMVSCSTEESMQPSFDGNTSPVTRAVTGDYAAADYAHVRIEDSDDLTQPGKKDGITVDNTAKTITLSNQRVYALGGVVRVPEDYTLVIPAGTYFSGTEKFPSALVIPMGAKIDARGTAANPIVFTSGKMLDNKMNTGANAPLPGDFAGVVLLGKAVINQGSAYIEGLPETAAYAYGGSTNNDNSGTMKYVRIEYAGFELSTDVELNGLTFGGVGSGTTIDHIQVSWGLDDGFEFFGGKVEASYLIAYACDDDGLDFDFGYTGTISNALVMANPASTHSKSSSDGVSPDSNGIELDNEATAPYLSTPVTHPTLNNVTVVGTATKGVEADGRDSYLNGARIRRNGNITMNNCVITGYPNAIKFDDPSLGNESSFNGTVIFGHTTFISPAQTLVGVTNSADALCGMGNPFYSSMILAPRITWHREAWTKFM